MKKTGLGRPPCVIPRPCGPNRDTDRCGGPRRRRSAPPESQRCCAANSQSGSAARSDAVGQGEGAPAAPLCRHRGDTGRQTRGQNLDAIHNLRARSYVRASRYSAHAAFHGAPCFRTMGRGPHGSRSGRFSASASASADDHHQSSGPKPVLPRSCGVGKNRRKRVKERGLARGTMLAGIAPGRSARGSC